MYRLHIDIPMPFTEEEALKKSSMIIAFLQNNILIEKLDIDQINYRLGHDDDRQKSNYFMKDENGHVNNKKSKIVLDKTEQV
jgi:hypothetical protein